MKPLHLIVVSLALVLSVQSYAQNFHLGTTFKDKKLEYSEILSDAKNEILVLGYRKKGFLGFKSEPVFLKFDKSLNLVSEKEFDFGGLSWKTNMNINGKLIFFFTEFDKETRRSNLYYSEFNRKTLTLKFKPKKIATYTIRSKNLYKKHGSVGWSIRLSENQSKILIYHWDVNNQETYTQYRTYLFNAKFKKLNRKVIKFRLGEDKFNFEGAFVTNYGDYGLYGYKYSKDRKLFKTVYYNYSYELALVRKEKKAVKRFPISIPSQNIVKFTVSEAEKGNLILMGFYTELGEAYSSIIGSFTIRLNKAKGRLYKPKLHRFSENLLTSDLSEREKKKRKKRIRKGKSTELPNYYFRDFIRHGDGSFTAIAEQYVFWVTTSTTTSNGVTSTKTTYHYRYGDVLVLRYNKSGKLLWERKISKNQYTKNDGGMYSSINIAEKNGDVLICYAESKKNFEGIDTYKKSNSHPSSKKSQFVAVKFTPKGVGSKIKLFDNKKSKMVMHTRKTFYSHKSLLMISTGSRGRKAIHRLKL